MKYRIFFSNVGYARAMDGNLKKHLMYAYRHVYCSPLVQQHALGELMNIIKKEKPDFCCLLEVDSGSFHSGYLNHMSLLINEEYPFHDIGDKYGTMLGKMPMHKGKSNAFLAKKQMPFQKRYFSFGSKRLVYRIEIEKIVLYFAHFSLRAGIRQKQFAEIRNWMVGEAGEVILLGDFNVVNGLQELDILLKNTDYRLLNDIQEMTFRFHKQRLLLDICICSAGIAESAKLKVIPQSFSDHDALLLDIDAAHFDN